MSIVPLAEPFFNGTGLMTQVQLYSRIKSWDDAAVTRGVPVPGTGVRRYRKSVNGAGVSANSRILPHRYADEGEKGREIRKMVRHRERALWLSEWQEEKSYDEYDAETVAQWFYDNSDDMDSDMIPCVYTVGETVIPVWDDYSSYDYDPGPYSISDYVDFNPYDFEGYAEYCYFCGGPCEL